MNTLNPLLQGQSWDQDRILSVLQERLRLGVPLMQAIRTPVRVVREGIPHWMGGPDNVVFHSMPSWVEIRSWLDQPGWEVIKSSMLAQQEEEAEDLMRQTLEIADSVVPTSADVAKASLQVKVRKDIAASLDRKKWGADKNVEVTVTFDLKGAQVESRKLMEQARQILTIEGSVVQ